MYRLLVLSAVVALTACEIQTRETLVEDPPAQAPDQTQPAPETVDASEVEQPQTPEVAPDAGVAPELPAAGQDAGVSAADAGSKHDAVPGPDASLPAISVPDAGPVVADPKARVLYTADRTHSPLTAEVVQHLHAIAARGPTMRSDVFMKVGDSITVNGGFMGCFDGDLTGQSPAWKTNVLLDGRDELADTVRRFRTTQVGATSPFSRVSLSAKVGASASFPLTGTPRPLDAEYDAALPRYAVVMYGSNDIGRGGSAAYSLADKLAFYETSLRALVDELLSRGVVPILSTMPPRQDDPQYSWIVPNFTAVARAVAQGRQIPLVDFNRELMALPYPHGIGGDGIHPTAQSYNSACWFRPQDLTYGYNVRNLVTLTALHRVDRALAGDPAAIDPPSPTQVGDGSAAAPFRVHGLPFTDLREAASGSAHVYELTLARPARLRAIVLDQQQERVKVSLLDAPGGTPRATAPRMIAISLPAGTHYLEVSNPASAAAEYTLTVVECDPADPRCG